MRRRRDSTTLAVLGTVAGAALVGTALLVVLRRRRRREPRLPQERRARRLLRTHLGPRAAERVIDSTDAHLHTLWDARPRFRDPALSEPTETLILPALALYRALRSEGLDETRALGLVEAVLVGERRRSRSAGVGRRALAPRGSSHPRRGSSSGSPTARTSSPSTYCAASTSTPPTPTVRQSSPPSSAHSKTSPATCSVPASSAYARTRSLGAATGVRSGSDGSHRPRTRRRP